MLKQLLAGVLGAVVSLPVFADVLVQSPDQLIVVAINDQEVRGNVFGGRSNNYKLDAGNHQIAVKYQELFEENYISHDIVRSNIVTLTTGNLVDGQTYQLVLLDPPKDHDAAKAFADRPVIGLKDAQGNIIAKQEGATSKARPWFGSGLFGGSDSVVDLRTEPAPTAKAVAAPVATSTVAVAATTPIATIAASNAKDQQLIELWKSATPQERQKFTAWLAEQASK